MGQRDDVHGATDSTECSWSSMTTNAYFAKIELKIDKYNSPSRIALLKLVVDSITSITINELVLKLVDKLLWKVEQMYSKHSKSYKKL